MEPPNSSVRLTQLSLGAVAGHELGQDAVGGVVALDDVHIGQHEVGRLGAVVVDHLRHLGEHVLMLAGMDVQRQGVGIGGLDGVVSLDGDHRRARLGLVGIVGNKGLGGPLLRGLNEVGVGGGADQAVAENHVVDLDGGKKIGIFQ